jgi:5-(carboxyamino)imidazole ribonucleotide mutase
MTFLVSLLIASQLDWEIVQHTELTLGVLGIPREVKILSPHRTPDQVIAYAKEAEWRGIEVIIASGYDAGQLPGLIAAHTLLPVLGIPLASESLNGLDALLSMTQMPMGFPVGTLAIGKTGAINAALLAAQILGRKYNSILDALREYRSGMTKKILDYPDPKKL